MGKVIHIKDLGVNVGRKNILNNISLDIEKGSINAIMGVNGSGKSTLLNAIFGQPAYKITGGSILYFKDNKTMDLQTMSPEERSKNGLFISYQTPPDFLDMTGIECLLLMDKAHSGKEISEGEFYIKYNEELKLLGITPEMLERPMNVGFSGGERKRMEVLQLCVCKPETVLLDEIDTGLDIDNLILIGNTLKNYVEKNKCTVMIVTHYLRFLDYLKPSKVFVIDNGKILCEGGYDVAVTIDQKGYGSLKKAI